MPNGSWDAPLPDVQLVPVEGSHPKATIKIPTTNVPPPTGPLRGVSSCSSNSSTGTTVCVDSGTGVYIIKGSTRTATLTDDALVEFAFSGGNCLTCGVVVDSSTNTAFVTGGFKPFGIAGPGVGFQTVDLATNKFGPQIPTGAAPGEGVVVDQIRHLILSANDETNNFQITQTEAPFNDFMNAFTIKAPDATGEDCTTGIGVTTVEGTNQLFVADFSHITFMPTTAPPTWTVPSQVQTFPEFDFMGFPPQFGVGAPAIAPNRHVGIVAGEFGGNGVGAIRLPATASGGIPAVADWASAVLPKEPDGQMFNTGLDPHTSTAYVSPTSKKAFGLIADVRVDAVGHVFPPAFLAVIDIEGLLTAPRKAGTHRVDPSFNLIAKGVVRYVSIH